MNQDQAMTFEELLERDGRLVYTNKGVSMKPFLRADRDLIIIEKKGAERCKELDAVLFRRLGANGRDAYVLHRILKVYDDGYWIVGDNCISGEYVNEEDVLGVLTAVVRGGRRIRMTDPACRLYANTWCKWYKGRFVILKTKMRARSCAGKAKRLLIRLINKV